jgi:putative hydrolase of the HAD superfamily
MKSKNPLLIFDLGNVVVPYDDKLLIDTMAALCADPAKAKSEIPLYFARDWDLLQTGKMQDRTLYEKFVAGLGFKGNFADFQKAWCSHTGSDPKMEKLVSDLAETHRIAILSNSTRTHWDHYNKNYPVLKKFDALYASHLLGAVKQYGEVFKTVLVAEKRSPSEAIFIDDGEKMVAAAEGVGIKSILFTGHDQLVESLRALGVKVPGQTSKPVPKPTSHRIKPKF